MTPVPNRAEDRPRAVGLYIHIPFCHAKCGYCDFFSVADSDGEMWPVVERTLRELASRLNDRGAADLRTIYIGGGTPTALPAEPFAELLDGLARQIPIAALDEFTVEANPATVCDEKAEKMHAAGVTRVSMGAQSFDPRELAQLERTHGPADVALSVATLRRHGIRSLNLDLIFGIPGQTPASWRDSLDRAIDLAPDHISCYGLTYEAGTPFAARRESGAIQPAGEETEAQMYELAIDHLAQAGYEQYEISAFAMRGRRCRHNLAYWRNKPYIGIGPSAAGWDGTRRYKNVADLAQYVRLIDERGNAEAECEMITGAVLMTELLMMQLRLHEGLSIADFAARTGVNPIPLFGATLTRLADLGLLNIDQTHIALTRQGRLMADAVIRELACAIQADEGEA